VAFRIIAHRHECETSWLACFSIGDDLNLSDAPKLFEHMLEVSFSDGERNISDVEFHGVMRFVLDCLPESGSRVPGFKSPLRGNPLTIYRASN
jgi:hypothetical protein